MNVVNINVNGLRTKKKRLLPGRLLEELQVGIRIVTETHQRRAELARFRIRGFHILGECCRPTPMGVRIGGGVLILVRNTLTAEPYPKLPGIGAAIEHCSVLLFPTDDPRTAIIITGVYISPANTGLLSRTWIGALSAPIVREETRTDYPHLIAGDFDVTTWQSMYDEWIQESGAQELLNPETPTFALGSTLDRMLFVPGSYIPPTFLAPGDSRFQRRDGAMDTPYYPAVVIEFPRLSDHSPVLLPLPCDTQDRVGQVAHRIRIGGLSDEEWQERGESLREIMEKQLPLGTLGQPVRNIHRYYGSIQNAIKKAFARESRTPKKTKEVDPFEHFLLANATHPRMGELLAAIETDAREESDHLINRISADGWRDHLKAVNISDTRSLFAFLTKSEGRIPWGFVPADAAPLLNARGEAVVSQQAKVGEFTRAVRERFTAPPSEGERLPRVNCRPDCPPRTEQDRELMPIRLVEVRKAVAELTNNRTPGPDGTPAGIFKKTTALLPYLRNLLTAIYQTGNIPEPLRRIYVIILHKPGKDPRMADNRRPISLICTIMKHWK